MLAKSTTFAGEWPEASGLHWMPDEVRTVPDDAELPDGIVPVVTTKGAAPKPILLEPA